MPTSPFTAGNPYSSTRIPVFARNAVSTSHPLGAQAGLRMLWRGGNAVDAAIAAAAAMTIVEPVSNGLGSDAFCILWDGKELHGLNASGRAPQAWTPEYFKRKYPASSTPPKRGMDSVTVPGAVAGWAAMSERFGAEPPWLDSYGATAPAEFFAVACEAYFVNRERFTEDFAPLTALFDIFFRNVPSPSR